MKNWIMIAAGLALIFFVGFGSYIMVAYPGIFRKDQSNVTPAVYKQKQVTPPSTDKDIPDWNVPKKI